MPHYKNLFHGTTEGYIRDMSIKGFFLGTARYTSKPIIALGWAKVYAKYHDDKMAIITLSDVDLETEIKSEFEGDTLCSIGTDIYVNQKDIEEGRNPEIKGIRIYKSDEMEAFIRGLVDGYELGNILVRDFTNGYEIRPFTIEDLINFYCEPTKVK